MIKSSKLQLRGGKKCVSTIIIHICGCILCLISSYIAVIIEGLDLVIIKVLPFKHIWFCSV